ncbi:large ribosomal subunit protein uL10m [Hetaerina americana]|uniref:large ribosomal subunit protein uL10m n=1 Tax=Hetaerina americana TaxID=62018 RepID=UPI003A7F61C2
MTTYIRKAFLVPWKPNLQSVRYRNKINIQRPALPHYERAKVLRVVQPMYNKPTISRRPSVELCLKPTSRKKNDEEENMYAKFLAKEMFIETEQSQFLGFFHTSPISEEEKFKVRVALLKHKGTLKVYGRRIAEMAWANSYYEPALCLFKSHTTLVFCPDGSPKTVRSIFKIFRRVPALLLMGAIVDKRMMDVSELEKYSKLSDLTTERAKFASLLNVAAGGSLVQNLSSLQNVLIHQLTLRATQLQSSGSETDGDNSVEGKLDKTE